MSAPGRTEGGDRSAERAGAAVGAVPPWAEAVDTLYAGLGGDPPAQWYSDLAALPPPVDVAAGTLLFDAGAPCPGFPLVLAGEVRVARGDPHGREIELYRVTPGEVCVVSMTCLFAGSNASAHGVASRDSRLLLVPPPMFLRWCAHEPFRRYVFGVLAERLADLMALAEAVAFRRMDQRLAAALLGHGQMLRQTHQQLADDIGTVREIVTRLLGRFERSGWVRLGRERIEVTDADALRRVAAGGTVA